MVVLPGLASRPRTASSPGTGQATGAMPTDVTVRPSFVPVAPALRPFVQRAACDGRRMGLVTPFGAEVNGLMRALGASWMPYRRMWLCEVDGLRELLDGLQRAAARLPAFSFDDARALAVAAWQNPQTDYFTSLLDVQVMPLARGGYAVSSAFDPLMVRALKRLGGRFHQPAQAWEVRRDRPEILRVLHEVAGVDETVVFVHEGALLLEDLVAGARSEVPITVPGAAAPATGGGAQVDPTMPLGAGFLSALGTPMVRLEVDEQALARATRECGLRDYQVAGVRHLLGLSSGLLADDMGLGKTRQAVVAGRLAAGADQVLVACPASLALNWEREIHAAYPAARIALVGQHPMAQVRAADWIIANYERLGGLVREASLRLAVMLVDEAHYLKEHQAGRTRNAFLLAERVPRRFLLTGTPVLNREIEVHTLLRLSGHPLGRMPLVDFRKQFAGDAGKRAQLAERVSEWMLRRGKDVLKDLGDKLHQTRVLQAPDKLAAYRSILADPSLQTMPKLTKLRQHLEASKVDFLIDSVRGLPQDGKALIFCEYMDTVDQLKEALASEGVRCVSLVGSDAPRKRMAAVDAFQQDPAVQVFIGTTMAAGVGITLTAANYVFFASLPWTPALKRQAEDRAYRSGNTRDVFVITPLVAGTIDEQIHALLEAKRDIEVSIVEANRVGVG